MSIDTPHRRLGQGPGQCPPEVRGRFAFPGAPNRSWISRFGNKVFLIIFLGAPETAMAFSSFLIGGWRLHGNRVLLMFRY